VPTVTVFTSVAPSVEPTALVVTWVPPDVVPICSVALVPVPFQCLASWMDPWSVTGEHTLPSGCCWFCSAELSPLCMLPPAMRSPVWIVPGCIGSPLCTS